MAKTKEKEYTLLETWRSLAYASHQTQRESDIFWGNYFTIEKGIYEIILADPKNPVKGTVKELAEKFETELLIMVGFLDGINDSLKTPNPIETMTEDTVVNLDYDIELLYKNMVEAKAEWLYELEAWNTLIPDANRRAELYKEQKSSHTIVKDKKIGRNEPCPCGSGKKYKFCCGR
ncbi:MAG: SEC-C domain-containing protein [Lachnospiraceae bacterium]|nr:SEC-C domain-containing protein [Lachnospiraceae bacterium]